MRLECLRLGRGDSWRILVFRRFDFVEEQPKLKVFAFQEFKAICLFAIHLFEH